MAPRLTGLLCVLACTLLAATAAALAAGSGANLTPAALHAAYSLPWKAPRAQTIGVVVAYNDPTLARDLQEFSSRFSLAPCTKRNRCLRVVNEQGKSGPLPPTDPTGGQWITEAALSTQTLHGICGNCRLLVVEASSGGKGDLAAAVDTAVGLGAREITTSYYFTETPTDQQYASHYEHPGVVITAASGDGGFSYGVNGPAAYPGVVAVGGTYLKLGARHRRVAERVWSNAYGTTASGCSQFTAAAAWQASYAAAVGCGDKRAVADIAAAAAPGAPVYSSTPLGVGSGTGWFEVGGTSLASPIIAGAFALAGGIGPRQLAPAVLYANYRAHPHAFHDITSGADGSCGGKPICQAGRGYDGPTGVGTPAGLVGLR